MHARVGQRPRIAKKPLMDGATLASWPWRTAGGLALLSCALLALEATTRVDDHAIRYGTPVLSPFRSQSDMLVRDVNGLHGRPRARFRQFVLNNLGMRGPDVAVLPSAGTSRVITLGASETFGLYEPEGSEFPRRLEACLNAMLENGERSSKRAEVLNAGLPGLTIPTSVQDLTLRLRHFLPDVVLLYPSPAQYLDDEAPVAARPDSSGGGIGSGPSRWAWLYPRSAGRVRDAVKAATPSPVATWLRKRQIEQSLRQHGPDWRFDSWPRDRAEVLDRDLRHFIGVTRALGATPLLMAHANRFAPNSPRDEHMLVAWEKFHPRASGAVLVAFDSVARELVRRAGADSGVAVVDLPATFPAERSQLFADFALHGSGGGLGGPGSVRGDSGRALVSGERSPAGMRGGVSHTSCSTSLPLPRRVRTTMRPFAPRRNIVPPLEPSGSVRTPQQALRRYVRVPVGEESGQLLGAE